MRWRRSIQSPFPRGAAGPKANVSSHRSENTPHHTFLMNERCIGWLHATHGRMAIVHGIETRHQECLYKPSRSTHSGDVFRETNKPQEYFSEIRNEKKTDVEGRNLSFLCMHLLTEVIKTPSLYTIS